MRQFEDQWAIFIRHVVRTNPRWNRNYKVRDTGETRTEFFEKGWWDSRDFVSDLKIYFNQLTLPGVLRDT